MSRSRFDSLIWFRGGRDACPAALLLLKCVKLGTAVLLLQEQKKKKKTCEGAIQSPVRKKRVSTQLFVAHIHENLYLILSENARELCCLKAKIDFAILE